MAPARALDWLINPFTSLTPLREASQKVSTKARRDFLAEPDLTTSYSTLDSIIKATSTEDTAVRGAMRGLLVLSGTRDEDIDIRKITALSKSKGRYIGNLPRLLSTIDEPSATVANLPREKQLEKVQDEVWWEFNSMVNGRFRVIEEGWSGRLIGINTGAARRFSMLHCECWETPLLFPAHIERMQLGQEAVKTLTAKHWVVLVPEDAACCIMKAATDAKVKGIEKSGRITNPGCPDEGEEVLWAVLSCPVSSRRYRNFRLAVEDAAIPHFDFSHWLRLLAHGRVFP